MLLNRGIRQPCSKNKSIILLKNLMVVKKELLYYKDFVASPKNKGDYVLAQEKEVEHAENFMKQFEDSGLKPLQPSYVDLMQIYMCLSM